MAETPRYARTLRNQHYELVLRRSQNVWRHWEGYLKYGNHIVGHISCLTIRGARRWARKRATTGIQVVPPHADHRELIEPYPGEQMEVVTM